MDFSVLHNKFAKHDMIVFFDLEGTQINHKAIAIGLVAYKKKIGEIDFDIDHPIKYFSLIKTDEPIGSVVQQLTSITDKDILERGKDIHDVVLDITKLLRPYKKCFISYGDLDILMLKNSLDFNDITESNFFRNVTKYYFDFHSYLMKRIVRDKGTAYSIASLLSLYDIKVDGKLHDPLTDSISLALIYKNYINQFDKTLSLVMKNLKVAPIKNQVYASIYEYLEKNESIDMDEAKEIVRKYL